MRVGATFRKVRLLLAAQVASQVGDASFSVLLLWSALQLSGSGLVVGAVATLNYLPVLLFGLVGGLAADRLPRRGLMIASDSVRAATAAGLALLAVSGLRSPWLLAAAGFVAFTASAFFSPARDAYIPALVETSELAAANSVVQLSVPLGWLFGPALCAALLPHVDSLALVGLAAVLFLISVGFLLAMPGVSAAPVAGPPAARDLLAGLVTAWRDLRLRWLLVITAVDNLLIMGPAVVGTPLLVNQVLGGSASDFAVLEALLAVGAVVGLPLALALNRRVGQGRILIAAIFLDGITYLPLLWTRSVMAAGVAVALHGVSIPMITVTRAALVQRIAPPEQLGRIFALIGMTVVGLTAVSSGLTGLVAAAVPVNVVFGVIAVLAALCGPAAWLSRTFRES